MSRVGEGLEGGAHKGTEIQSWNASGKVGGHETNFVASVDRGRAGIKVDAPSPARSTMTPSRPRSNWSRWVGSLFEGFICLGAGRLDGEVWIEGLVVFEDAVGQAEEVVHDGADHAHFSFAGGAQSFGAGFKKWVASRGDDGGQVERLPQARVARFAEARLTAQ